MLQDVNHWPFSRASVGTWRLCALACHQSSEGKRTPREVGVFAPMFQLASVYMCVAERGTGGSGSTMGKGWSCASAINIATMRRSWRMSCGMRKTCLSLSSEVGKVVRHG